MKSFSRWLLAFLVAASLVFLAGGVWLRETLREQWRHEAEEDLQAISELKARQIADWRAERLADAAVLVSSSDLVARAAQWLAEPDTEAPSPLAAPLRSLCEHYGYDEILLTDATGHVRWSLSGRLGTLAADTAGVLAEAMRRQRPVLTDLHRGAADRNPHIGVIAPLRSETGGAGQAAGAVILQCDARQFLYPLLQSWPTPSATAETLLVRRDGDSVLFLNELRHQPDTALRLRIPLHREDVPAVMAVMGREGTAAGRDYRGVEVLSAMRVIPNSPWFLVAKLDAEEAYEAAQRQATLVLELLAVGTALVVAVIGLFWQRNWKAHFRKLFLAEAARRKTEERYRTTLLSIGDGVIATDTEGRVELMNPVAESLTGWAQDAALGKPVEEVFAIVNEETGQQVENPVRRVVREGTVVGLANHTLLIARDGARRPIADSGAPVRGEQDQIAGVVLVFRDQTSERAAQQALRDSVQEYLDLFRGMLTGFAVHEVLLDEQGQPVDYRFLSVNPAFERLTGLTAQVVVGRRVLEVLPALEPFWIEAYGRVATTGEAAWFEHYSRALRKHFEVYAFRPRPGQFVCTFYDVTQRKRVEDELLLRAEQLQTRNDELERFNRVTTDRELRMIELKREVNELCRQAGLPLRYQVDFADAEPPL